MQDFVHLIVYHFWGRWGRLDEGLELASVNKGVEELVDQYSPRHMSLSCQRLPTREGAMTTTAK